MYMIENRVKRNSFCFLMPVLWIFSLQQRKDALAYTILFLNS